VGVGPTPQEELPLLVFLFAGIFFSILDNSRCRIQVAPTFPHRFNDFELIFHKSKFLRIKFAPPIAFVSKATLFIFLASLMMPQDFILKVSLAG
jgi:hypothetical protein